MVGYLVQLVRMLIPPIVGWALSQTMGWTMAWGICAVCAVSFPAIGVLLLRTVKEGELNWKNLVAGWLLPWGYRIGKGKLMPIAIISAVVWACLFGMGIFIGQDGALQPSQQLQIVEAQSAWNWPVVMNAMLALSWLIDGAALFCLAGQLSRQTNFQQPPGSTLAKITAIVGILILASVVLKLTGQSNTALLIAGVPPLLVGLAVGVWFTIILTFGRNVRWN